MLQSEVKGIYIFLSLSVLAGLAFFIAGASVRAQTGPVQTTVGTTISCRTLTNNLFYYQDVVHQFYDGAARVAKDRLDNAHVHAILQAEGLAVSATERSQRVIQQSTAGALVKLQEKYAAELLTPRGLTNGFGWVDETTRNWMNQKYGCNSTTAGIELLSPNGGETLAVGQTLPITWKTTTAIKTNDVVTIKMEPQINSSTGPISYIIATVANNKSYSWTIPSQMNGAVLKNGKYYIAVTAQGKTDYSNGVFTLTGGSTSTTTATTTTATTTPTGTVPVCTKIIVSDIYVGISGDEVTSIQRFLKAKGYYAGAINGYYDESSRLAAVEYQRSKGISPLLGGVGPITRAAINADCVGLYQTN